MSSCHTMHTYTAIIIILHCRGPGLIRGIGINVQWAGVPTCTGIGADLLIDLISTGELTTFYVLVKKRCKKLNINNSVFTWLMTSKL